MFPSLFVVSDCPASSLPMANASSFDISPLFLTLVLAVAVWKVISWILYLEKKSELDAQISARSAQAEQSAGGPANTATVYIYRLSNLVGALNPCYVYCDQAPIAGLKSGAHAACKVAPGIHVFTSSVSTATIQLNLQAGQVCFIRTGVTGLNSSAFEAVSLEHARAESSALRKMVDQKRILAALPPIIGEQRPSAAATAMPAVPPPLPETMPPQVTPPSAAIPPPPAINTPLPAADSARPGLLWYQHVWIALPLLLLAVGGIIGGACGGAAWALNQQVFRKTKESVLRYVWTALISAGAVIAYLVVASLVASLLAPNR